MNTLYYTEVATAQGTKSISVVAQDVLQFTEDIDVLTTSAFIGAYDPTPGTMFAALHTAGMDIQALADRPYIDLREVGNVWLSETIASDAKHIKRLGCVEMSHYGRVEDNNQQEILLGIKSYFHMLDIATVAGVEMKTVAMPLLGGGRQGISRKLTLIPLIRECIDFLKRNETVERIYFIDINRDHALEFADCLKNMYSLLMDTKEDEPLKRRPRVFISYSSVDQDVTTALGETLEQRGIDVWYAPRNVSGDYATAIVNAIDRATHFVVIISKSSLASEHVLNEIDLAFHKLPNGIKFMPLRIDETELPPAFRYYLSRQHWTDALTPPLDAHLEPFVTAILAD